jgi:branched-subunit amino acid ABC-type transport system permease component
MPYTKASKKWTTSYERLQLISAFVFKFLVKLGWQPSLGRFQLNWQYYFKELFKSVDINVATPSWKKQFSVAFQQLFLFKKKKRVCDRILFWVLCVTFWQFLPKEKTGIIFRAILDNGPRSGVQWNQAFLLDKSFKLVSRPIHKRPRPR